MPGKPEKKTSLQNLLFHSLLGSKQMLPDDKIKQNIRDFIDILVDIEATASKKPYSKGDIERVLDSELKKEAMIQVLTTDTQLDAERLRETLSSHEKVNALYENLDSTKKSKVDADIQQKKQATAATDDIWVGTKKGDSISATIAMKKALYSFILTGSTIEEIKRYLRDMPGNLVREVEAELDKRHKRYLQAVAIQEKISAENARQELISIGVLKPSNSADSQQLILVPEITALLLSAGGLVAATTALGILANAVEFTAETADRLLENVPPGCEGLFATLLQEVITKLEDDDSEDKEKNQQKGDKATSATAAAVQTQGTGQSAEPAQKQLAAAQQVKLQCRLAQQLQCLIDEKKIDVAHVEGIGNLIQALEKAAGNIRDCHARLKHDNEKAGNNLKQLKDCCRTLNETYTQQQQREGATQQPRTAPGQSTARHSVL